MADRPYVILSCAASLDGYIDDTSPERLVLSSVEDLARVDAVRAGCDAILIGAETVRRDNPRLGVRGSDGPTGPRKVTVTASGRLPAAAACFTTGRSPVLVYCPPDRAARLRRDLGHRARVVARSPLTVSVLASDLHARGIRRLLVEGGASVQEQFLAAGIVDELHLAVAPILVGDDAAPRVATGRIGWTRGHRAVLAGVQRAGDTAVLTYALSDRFVAEPTT